DQFVDLQQRCHAGASTWRQRASCPAAIATAGGGAARQAAVTRSQRSANGQPPGRSASSGTRPGIVGSRVPRGSPSLGRAANRPRVYGCASLRKTPSVGPLSTTVPPYITIVRRTVSAITP